VFARYVDVDQYIKINCFSIYQQQTENVFLRRINQQQTENVIFTKDSRHLGG